MKQISNISVQQLELEVFLGVPEEENSLLQKIWLDFDIHFSNLSKACISDNIDDTICYDNLVNLIAQFCSGKKFHLIEHLGYKIYHLLKESTQNLPITIKISKKPLLKYSSSGVCFKISDN